MNLIKTEIDIRIREIDEFIQLNKNIEDNNISLPNEIDKILINTTLKSSILIILYNLIESTVTRCLRKIHDEISSKSIKYSDLNDNIKKLFIVYYHSMVKKEDDVHNTVSDIIKLISILKHNEYISFKYDEMEKYYSLYSGNLDSKKIRSVFSKYGIYLEKKLGELRLIKDYRNKLSHGEISFEECGREITIQQIEVSYQKLREYLNEIVNIVEDFIETKKYLSPNLINKIQVKSHKKILRRTKFGRCNRKLVHMNILIKKRF